MGTYGGLAPQPERYGGGKRRVEYILDALLHSDQIEIGLDTTPANQSTPPNPVWIEEVATARALNAAWNTNERGANEFDPRKTQSMLPRWEKIFGIVPLASDSLSVRRARVTFRFQALGKSPTYGQINDDLTYLGTAPDGQSSAYVGLVHTSSATGPLYYPGSPFANPYDPSGTTTFGVSIVDWWSAVLNLAVQVTQPVGMSGTVFADLCGAMAAYLDGALPAWMTFCLFQDAHQVGGAFFQGVYLDEPNLGIEAFAV